MLRLLIAMTASFAFTATGSAQVTGTIDFEGLTPGALISELSSSEGVGPISIYGSNERFPGMNVATIFDSAAPTGGDVDLGTPNETFGGPGIGVGGEMGQPYENSVALGKVLIVNENLTDVDKDGIFDDIDDEGTFDVRITVDFRTITAPFSPDNVTVQSLGLLDVETSVNESASLEFYDAEDNLITVIIVPDLGDNGAAELPIGVTGVAYFVLDLAASGAITDVIFEIEEDDEMTGNQGCTPGYWKNHLAAWDPTGYTPDQTIESVFAAAGMYGVAGTTLLENLQNHGGGGAEGAARILLRAAVASLLNASNPHVGYPRTTAEVIDDVNLALLTGHRPTILSLATDLDDDNNLGCPIGLGGAVETD